MKGKKTVYVLLPLVLSLWGIIGWKIYAATRTPDVHETRTDSVLRNTTPGNIPGDTFTLLLNYRDPFLDKGFDHKMKSSSNPSTVVSVIPKQSMITATAPIAVKWPGLQYFGLVKRNVNEKLVGFLSVDGSTFFVKGGDEAGEVTVGKVWKDSVEIFLGKERRVIAK